MGYDEIVSQGLNALGQNEVEGAIANHARREVRVMVRQLELARRFVISEHDWFECQMSFPLALVSVTGATRSGYYYSVPPSLIRMSTVTADGQWQLINHMDADGVVNRYLWGDRPIASAFGLFLIEWSLLSDQLARLIWIKAALTAMVAITGSDKLRDGLEREYAIAFQDALTLEAFNQDMNEEIHFGLHKARWTEV